ALRRVREAADDRRQALARIGQQSRFRIEVRLERPLWIGNLPARGGIARRRADPRDDEVIEAPILDRDIILLGLEYGEAEFLNGKPVADCGNHTDPAGPISRRDRLFYRRLSLSHGLLDDRRCGWRRLW